MATEYALQHRTSKRYLAADPALNVHVETPDEPSAFTWKFMTEAELAHIGMNDFKDAWDVVFVIRPDHPYPLEREGPRFSR